MESVGDRIMKEQDSTDGCVHEDAVKWNPFNHVVQCHRCGKEFVVEQDNQPTALSAERYILLHKIKTLQFMSFMSGVSFGIFVMVLISLIIDKD